jgi:DNA-binding XRE family transcriptional regulator
MGRQGSSFGSELRRRRVGAGLSLAQLAGRLHYSKGHLSKIETGTKPPSMDLVRRCDAELDAGGELVALATPPVSAGHPGANAAGVDGVDGVWTMRLVPDGTSRFFPMGMRAAAAAGDPALLGLSLGSVAMPSAGQGRGRAPAPGPAVSMFRSLFDGLRRLGQSVSPAVVLPMVISQTHVLRGLAAATTASEREDLLLLAAFHAEFTGWMAQEAGDERAAIWWTRKAVEMVAPTTGKETLAAYALVRRAEITLYRDDAIRTIELARAAQLDHKVPPRVRGLAAQREAQGHALRGDYDDCLRTLDRAAELLAAPATAHPGGPVIGSSSVSNLNAVVMAWCLHDLGRSQEAAAALDKEVPGIPENALRARVRFGIRQALAHAAVGEIDHACELARQMLEGIARIDSATVRTDLRRLVRTLVRWHDYGPVREVYPLLIEALRTEAV